MSMLENHLEVSVESEPGLPGVDVLTFELISFKTPTRLLLAAYVPREGYDTEYLRKRFVFDIFLDRSAEGSSISHHIYVLHSPVAFAKFRLQEADAVPRTSNFLLQPVKSINH